MKEDRKGDLTYENSQTLAAKDLESITMSDLSNPPTLKAWQALKPCDALALEGLLFFSYPLSF